jgi:preprotein translocase subunit SecB
MSSENNSSITVHSQYIKDLSFEGPESLSSLKLKTSQPQFSVGFDVKVARLETSSDVSLFFHIEADLEGEKVFVLELTYVGSFSLHGVSQDREEEILFTGCSAMLFPFARQIIAHTISNAGFPPVMLDYINFAAFYRNKILQEEKN